MKKLALLLALLSTAAHAQSVRQSGNITPGHVASWVTTGVIADGGPASGTTIVGATTQNDFVCFNGSGSLIDCGLSATGTNNWTGLQNFNGGATAPTRAALDSTTNVATTQFVTSAATTILSTPNTWTALQTFNAGIAGTTQQFSTGIASAPAALPGTQRPVNLYNCTSDNIPIGNIECSMTNYTFGGSSMTGNRFAGYDFIFNTAATNNTFGQYAGRFSGAYTSVGDGGTMGAERGAWFGANIDAHLDTGSGLYNFSAQATEFDTIVHSAAQAKYEMGITIIGSLGAHANTMESAIVIGGSTLGGTSTKHLGWNNIFTLSDIHKVTNESPVNTSTTVFNTYWTAGGTKTITTWMNLLGLTGSGFILNSAGTTIDWSGNYVAGTWTGTGAMVVLNATAPPAGGTAGFGYRFSSTANFGTFFGSGAPSLSAAQGSLYLRSDGLPYYNTNGTTGWGSLAPLASPTFTGTVTYANLAAVGLLASATAPVIGACGGGSPAIAAHNGTAAFRVTGGSGNSTCAITLPSAPTGWNCYAANLTTQSATVFVLKQTASSQTSVTLTNFNTSGASANFVNGDTFAISCFAL